MLEYKIIHIKHGKIVSADTYYDYEEFEEMFWFACDMKSKDTTIAVIVTTPNR